MHLLLSFGSIGSRGEFDVAKSADSSVSKQSSLWVHCTHPLERPVALSLITLTPASSPNFSNSLVSQSSSTFHDKFPTKRLPDAGAAPAPSVFDFFAAGTASASALRFFGAASTLAWRSSSDSSESSESSESSSDPSLSSSESGEP